MRDQYGVAVLVVHHTKKGVRYGTMHNDNIRGLQVFSASADSYLQLRRSGQDGSKRVFKHTKLRSGNDELMRAHLLGLEGNDLWFLDEGEVNEQDHLPVQGGSGRQTAEDDINLECILTLGVPMKRKDIIEKCEQFGFSERTADRCIKKETQENGVLVQPKYGVYELRPPIASDEGAIATQAA